MTRQKLLIAALLGVAVAIVGVLFLAPRLGRPEVLTGYVEGEPLYLAAPVSGTITQMSVVRGQRVAAGARLFVVDRSRRSRSATRRPPR